MWLLSSRRGRSCESSRLPTSARCRSSPRRQSSLPLPRSRRSSRRGERHSAVADGRDPQRAGLICGSRRPDSSADAHGPLPGGVRDDLLGSPIANLLTEFVAAARGATSFADAFERALATLCERIGGTSAVLLEQDRRRISLPRRDPRRRGPALFHCPPAGFSRTASGSTVYPLPFSAGDLESGCAGQGSTAPNTFARSSRCSMAARGWRCRSGQG